MISGQPFRVSLNFVMKSTDASRIKTIVCRVTWIFHCGCQRYWLNPPETQHEYAIPIVHSSYRTPDEIPCRTSSLFRPSTWLAQRKINGVRCEQSWCPTLTSGGHSLSTISQGQTQWKLNYYSEMDRYSVRTVSVDDSKLSHPCQQIPAEVKIFKC